MLHKRGCRRVTLKIVTLKAQVHIGRLKHTCIACLVRQKRRSCGFQKNLKGASAKGASANRLERLICTLNAAKCGLMCVLDAQPIGKHVPNMGDITCNLHYLNFAWDKSEDCWTVRRDLRCLRKKGKWAQCPRLNLSTDLLMVPCRTSSPPGLPNLEP